MLFRSCLLASALLFCLPACGSDSGEDGNSGSPDAAVGAADAGPVTHTESMSFTFFEARFIEPRIMMEAGDKLLITMSSTPGPVYFDIHAHVNDETTYFAEEEGAELEFEFVAPESSEYFILVGNKSNAETIEADVSFEMEETSMLLSWGI